MNRRFTTIFLKYIITFLILSLIVVIIGLFIFGVNVNSVFSNNDPAKIDSYELIGEINDDEGYILSDSLKESLNEAGYTPYIVDDEANTIYPKIDRNLKTYIIKNITSTIALPYKNNAHFLMIKETNGPELNISNIEEVDTLTLIDSLYSQNYNKYTYHIIGDELKFFDSPTSQDYAYVDEFSDTEITVFKLIGALLLFVPLFIILLAVILSVIMTRRLSKPLFFYVDWLTQLSNGLLYKPSASYNRKKSKKIYKELDEAVESLNTQLLEDRLYQNQIDYYRTKWLNQISHDLKSPLTSIYGYSKVMPYFPDDQKEYITLISDKAIYMEQLIDSLNSTFKIETSQMELDKESFSLARALKEIIKTVGYKDINIDNHLDDDEFYGNKLYVERMFINLIENSLDHNEKNPIINISLEDNVEGIVITYEDDGQGIDQKDLSKLMQSKQTTKEVKDQHGLGFTIIMDAVNFHNGSFTAAPAEYGVKFIIHFR